jgi:hypothetical protein
VSGGGRAVNPVTRVDNWLLWEGGYCREMTLWERFKWRLGLLRTVKQ